MSSKNRKQGSNEGLSRRSFLARAGAGAAGAATASVWMSGVTRGATPVGARTAIFLNMRGGQDAMSVVCPVTEAAYQAARPNIHVPAPPTSDRAWLDAKFALSPGGVDYVNNIDMIRPYSDQNLVFVHGAGWTNQPRSHFTAMLNMEHGVEAGSASFPLNGWGGRYLVETPPSTAVVRAFHHGNLLPTILRGGPQTTAIGDVSNLTFPGPDGGLTGTIPTAPFREHTISKSYEGSNRPLAKNAATQAFATLESLSAVSYPSDPTALGYPDSELGETLAHTAAIINDPAVHVEVVSINLGSWDHHADLNPLTPGGRLYDLLEDLSRSVGAFYLDVGPANVDKYLMMIYTEFGRQTAENEDRGADHGYGSLFTAMGSGVHPSSGGAGGTVWHEFTGDLSTSFDPLNGDALDLTIDYRDIWKEALLNQLCLPSGAESLIFPGFNFRATTPGIIG